MTLASRIIRLPIPIDPARGQSAVDRAGIADPVLADLVRGAAGCSPYLAGLIQREADWLADRLADASAADADVVAQETAGFQHLAADALGPALRRAKRRIALWAALCDLGGIWRLDQVTGALTGLADRATDLALRVHVAHEAARG